MATLMNAKDAVWAGRGSCYLNINGTRYNFLQATKVSATAKKTKKKIPILGKTSMGNKAAGMAYEGKMSFYYNTSIFRNLIKQYQDKGQDFYFDMVVTNEDETTAVGKQVVILKDCNLDEAVIAMLEAGGDPAVEDASFTYEDFELPTEFTMLDGMQQ